MLSTWPHRVKAMLLLQVKASKESVAPLSAPTPAPLRTAPKNEEQVAAPTPSPVPETVPSGTNVNENGNVQEVEGL